MSMYEFFQKHEPCYRCSLDENETSGMTELRGGVKTTSSLKDEAGACLRCGHVTTSAEREALGARRSTEAP